MLILKWKIPYNISSLLDVSLGSNYASAQRLTILKNRMKSVENKAMLKSMLMSMTGLQSPKKRIGKFLWVSEP